MRTYLWRPSWSSGRVGQLSILEPDRKRDDLRDTGVVVCETVLAAKLGLEGILVRAVFEDDKHPITSFSIGEDHRGNAVDPSAGVSRDAQLLLQYRKFHHRQPRDAAESQGGVSKEESDLGWSIENTTNDSRPCSLSLTSGSRRQTNPNTSNSNSPLPRRRSCRPRSKSWPASKWTYPVQYHHLSDGQVLAGEIFGNNLWPVSKLQDCQGDQVRVRGYTLERAPTPVRALLHIRRGRRDSGLSVHYSNIDLDLLWELGLHQEPAHFHLRVLEDASLDGSSGGDMPHERAV